MASTPPQCTTRGDGFGLEFAVDDVVPLDLIKNLSRSVDSFRCIQTDEEVSFERLPNYLNNNDNEKLHKEVKVLRDLKHYHCI